MARRGLPSAAEAPLPLPELARGGSTCVSCIASSSTLTPLFWLSWPKKPKRLRYVRSAAGAGGPAKVRPFSSRCRRSRAIPHAT